MNLSRRHALRLPLVLFAPSMSALAQAPATPYALQIDEAMPAAVRAGIEAWVTRSAQVVTAYFGRFPAPQCDLAIVADSGAGVKSGRTFDALAPGIRVVVGVATTREQFLDDWILVHEMVHLAISQMPRTHSWFHEGAATYVEIVARARAGLTSAQAAWGNLYRDLPNGLPLPGEGGIDGTRRWGRTYWGGALFFLQCDLEIRQGSSDRLGLQDALAGLVRAGSHYGQRWPLEQTLRTADAAVGLPVMTRLYAQVRDEAVPVDLPRLWRELGVRKRADGDVVLEADAPRVATRRAIVPE